MNVVVAVIVDVVGVVLGKQDGGWIVLRHFVKCYLIRFTS